MNRALHRILSLAAAALSLAAIFAPATASAFDLTAKLERDFNTLGGPQEYACTFCANRSTQVSAHFNGGFPPPATPVATPPNSQIVGDAFGNLTTGQMTGNSFASSYGHNEQHQMRFISRMRETIEIHVPSNMPDAERFATFIGQVTASATATNRATAVAIYSLDLPALRGAASVRNAEGWRVLSGSNPAIDSTPLVDGVLVIGHRFVIRKTIPVSGVMQIESQLEGTAWAEARIATGVAIANVDGARASLTMILPTGATYTSTSGVFLKPQAIQAWRQQHFGSPDNSGPGTDTADPDGDGTVNLLEFAMLTNPMIATTLPIEQTLSGENLEFTYTRNKAALDELTFAVASSDSPASASWSTAGVTEIILSDDGTAQQIKATLPAGVMRRFVHLSVTRAP